MSAAVKTGGRDQRALKHGLQPADIVDMPNDLAGERF
jgi:hypothetical protein